MTRVFVWTPPGAMLTTPQSNRHPEHVPEGAERFETRAWPDVFEWLKAHFGHYPGPTEQSWASAAHAYGIAKDSTLGDIHEVGGLYMAESCATAYANRAGYTIFDLAPVISGRRDRRYMNVLGPRHGMKRSDVAELSGDLYYGVLTPDGRELPRVQTYVEAQVAALRHLHPHATHVTLRHYFGELTSDHLEVVCP